MDGARSHASYDLTRRALRLSVLGLSALSTLRGQPSCFAWSRSLGTWSPGPAPNPPAVRRRASSRPASGGQRAPECRVAAPEQAAHLAVAEWQGLVPGSDGSGEGEVQLGAGRAPRPPLGVQKWTARAPTRAVESPWRSRVGACRRWGERCGLRGSSVAPEVLLDTTVCARTPCTGTPGRFRDINHPEFDCNFRDTEEE